MFDILSSRSLRAACIALCMAALPLSGCPEEENNKANEDMGSVAMDMGQTADAGETPDTGGSTEEDAGTPDAGTPDAGPDDAGEDTDAGPSLVCMAGETECATNDQCAANERCESVEGSVTGCCREGARGTKAAGEECTSGDECLSSLCIDSTQDQGDDDTAVDYCSAECVNAENMPDDTLCPTQLPKCNVALGICIPSE